MRDRTPGPVGDRREGWLHRGPAARAGPPSGILCSQEEPALHARQQENGAGVLRMRMGLALLLGEPLLLRFMRRERADPLGSRQACPA